MGFFCFSGILPLNLSLQLQQYHPDFRYSICQFAHYWNVKANFYPQDTTIDTVGESTGFGAKNVKILEVENEITARNERQNSQVSEDDEENDQIICFKGDNMKINNNLMKEEEGENSSIHFSHHSSSSSTVTRRIVKTIISTSHSATTEKNIPITEL